MIEVSADESSSMTAQQNLIFMNILNSKFADSTKVLKFLQSQNVENEIDLARLDASELSRALEHCDLNAVEQRKIYHVVDIAKQYCAIQESCSSFHEDVQALKEIFLEGHRVCHDEFDTLRKRMFLERFCFVSCI